MNDDGKVLPMPIEWTKILEISVVVALILVGLYLTVLRNGRRPMIK